MFVVLILIPLDQKLLLSKLVFMFRKNDEEGAAQADRE